MYELGALPSWSWRRDDIADVADIFMGRGELFHHLLHESLDLDDAFLRCGTGLHNSADGFLRSKSLYGVFTALMISVFIAFRSVLVASSLNCS